MNESKRSTYSIILEILLALSIALNGILWTWGR